MMIRTPLGSPQRDLFALFRGGVATILTDEELLERFAASRDHSGQLAFATLVARHGPMVMSVCRRILHNPADADDAFQATFLVLVRSAGALRFGSSLGPWLYGVRVRVARRARDLGARAIRTWSWILERPRRFQSDPCRVIETCALRLTRPWQGCRPTFARLSSCVISRA